jgi:SAM-dependent methyltransferase
VSDLPVALTPELAVRLATAMDREGKIVRALETLAPMADRDVLLIDAVGSPVAAGLGAAGARLVHAPLTAPLRLPVDDASLDVVIGLWSAFRGVDRSELAEVDRALRPDGRLLVVHHYGRDDVTRLLGDPPEYSAWSRPNGPFLSNGFRVRVLHCWWEFDTQADLMTFVGDAFGEAGRIVGAALSRPRVAHKVAVYHRSRSPV